MFTVGNTYYNLQIWQLCWLRLTLLSSLIQNIPMHAHTPQIIMDGLVVPSTSHTLPTELVGCARALAALTRLNQLATELGGDTITTCAPELFPHE